MRLTFLTFGHGCKPVTRKNEQTKHWFRSERLFTVDGFWYFSTREGLDLGPYESRSEAQIEAGFLRELLMGQPGEDPGRTVQRFVREGEAFGRSLTPGAPRQTA